MLETAIVDIGVAARKELVVLVVVTGDGAGRSNDPLSLEIQIVLASHELGPDCLQSGETKIT